MKIAFFTEGSTQGLIPRNYPNMRTELAWMCTLNAEHFNINEVPPQVYDLGIIIVPKKNPHFDLERIKSVCKKVAVMQEGPNWFWQDYDIATQIWYYNTLCSVDYIFAHNESDVLYYKGLINHPNIHVLQSLMIEDTLQTLPTNVRKGVLIGGNFTSWYSGFDSMIVANEIAEPIGEKVYAPSMGRKQPNEEALVAHLPYMQWTDWIFKLNEFKYAVHLMRTHAAGTFALNCSYLSIPCIGYGPGLDTQTILHPNLTVTNLYEAREKAKLLVRDDNFYMECSKICKENYHKFYSEEAFKEKFYKIVDV